MEIKKAPNLGAFLCVAIRLFSCFCNLVSGRSCILIFRVIFVWFRRVVTIIDLVVTTLHVSVTHEDVWVERCFIPAGHCLADTAHGDQSA